MSSLDLFARAKLEELEVKSLRRDLVETHRLDNGIAIRAGNRLISFSCNDYLNLAADPRVNEAAQQAIERYGVGAGASRLVTGNHPLYRQLETKLAKLKQTEEACVFGSGYLANLGIIPSLINKNDLLIVDELSHACILAGSKLCSSTVEFFHHNDVSHLKEILATRRSYFNNTMIVTDGVFSMDGDLAPLEDLATLSSEYNSWLMTDDAHGVGVLGSGGGSSFTGTKKINIPLQMGTLSKAIGTYGGYLCASKPVIDLIRTRARTLIYSTGLPPAVIGASIAALEIIETEPALVKKPLQNAQLFTRLTNLPLAKSSIVPLILGGAEETLAASRKLEEKGFLVTAIRPPTVPPETARLRFAFTAGHKSTDIERVAAVIRQDILNEKDH
jgi:8-amino-7-oxononanoate synthase